MASCCCCCCGSYTRGEERGGDRELEKRVLLATTFGGGVVIVVTSTISQSLWSVHLVRFANSLFHCCLYISLYVCFAFIFWCGHVFALVVVGVLVKNRVNWVLCRGVNRVLRC